MASVDSRIVTMKFDNAQFERGANQTMHTLDNLSKSLTLPGAVKGLTDVQDAANRMSFGHMEGGITKISTAFLAMSTVAITALSNITNKAIDTGMQVTKSLTIDPIKGGFDEYELKMGSIQTIMAGSGESLDVVNKKLSELNAYSDKTIYSFKDMTSNIGKFTNAGVSLDKSVAAIQGVANVAAISGANAEEASRSMYNFAQALSSGSVKLQDWKSIELANMATVEFKTQLLDAAVAAGTLTKAGEGMYKQIGGTDEVITSTKNFNETLKDGWLTSEALIETLGKYSDETTDIGKRATAAAQDVKTFSQMMDTLRESAGSGWAETSEIIFGNFEEAKQLWTGINNVVSGALSKSADARNELLRGWKEAGGRDALIEGLKNAFNALSAVIKPIKDAFREIFPAKTVGQLYEMTARFRDFTEKLKISGETAENLKRTFKGVFAIFSIVWQVVKGVIGVIGDLVGALFSGDGGFLRFTANIGDFFVKLDEFLKKGLVLKNFFAALGGIISAPITAIKAITGFIVDLFATFGDKAPSAGDAVDRFKERLASLGEVGRKLQTALGSVGDFFAKLWEKMQPFIDGVKDVAAKIGKAFQEAFGGEGGFSLGLDVVNTGIFAVLALAIKNFLSGGLFGGANDIIQSITDSFNALTGVLQSMQANIQANTLIKIAVAVGLLTASIVVLSLIDPERLRNAMLAISAAFTELMIALKIMEKVSGSASVRKMSGISFSLILLATAILILSSAVKKMGELSWGELTRGLLGLAALLLILKMAVKPLSDNAKEMIKAAIGIGILGIALKILVSVVKDFSEMNLGETAKGMGILAAALIGIAVAMRLMPKNMMRTAISLAVLSLSLKVIASVIEDLGNLRWQDIVQGVGGLTGALIGIAVAMRMMPKNMLMQSASLIVLGFALQVIAKAIESMGAMSMEEMAKGLGTLAGALLIIAIALNVMQGTIAGSAALLIAAAALAILAGVLKVLGSMELGDIIQALVALAAIFVILGVAGLLLAPVVPIIALLGASLLLIGAALLFAGVGALAFASAIMILVGLGGAAAYAIESILSAVIGKIPELFKKFGEGIVAFAEAIAQGGPAFIKAFTTVLDAFLQSIIDTVPKAKEAFMTVMNAILDSIIELAPKIGEAINALIDMILDVLTESIPKMVDAGLEILTGILMGIAQNIHRIVTVATTVIKEFIRAIGNNAPRLMDEGAQTIIKFINGISDAIDKHSEELGKAGGRLASSIVKGMLKGFTGAAGEVAKGARDMAKGAFDAAMDFLKADSPSKLFMDVGRYVDEGFAIGITKHAKMVDASIDDMGNSALDTMKQTMIKISDAAVMSVDTQPVVAPVLDLTQVEKEAQKLNKLISANPLAIDASFTQASAISADQLAKQVAEAELATTTPSTMIQFEQNNYSPTALSNVEIYRQTKNQLSLAKEALNV